MYKNIKKIKLYGIISLTLILILTVASSLRQQQINHLIRIIEEKYSKEGASNNLYFNIYLMQIPCGFLKLQIKEDRLHDMDVYETQFSLRPRDFLTKISSGNIGLDIITVMDQENFLPLVFQQIDLYSQKKGKTGRIIEYHHDDLYMKRKGDFEDIEDDTRDYLSLWTWLMFQDYEKKSFIKSTLNINKEIFLVVGKVKNLSLLKGNRHSLELVELRLNFSHLTKDYKIKNMIPLDVHLIKRGDRYIPILFKTKMAVIPLTVALH